RGPRTPKSCRPPSALWEAFRRVAQKIGLIRTHPNPPHIAGVIGIRPKGRHLLPKVSVAESINLLRRRYPGCLVCATCARLIATTPAGYTNSTITTRQVDSYICASCRSDAQIAAETTARFRALVPRVELKPPLRIVAAAGEPARRPDESDTAHRERL